MPTNNVQRYRENLMMSKAELARKAGLSTLTIDRVEAGEWDIESSPLRHAPHTAEELVGEWDRPYPRELGAFPLDSLRAAKYFPPVSRIDGAYGDRHLVCSCEPLEAYAETGALVGQG